MFIAMSLGNQRFAEHSQAVDSGAARFKVQTFFSPTLIYLASFVAVAAVISMPIKTPECLSLCLGAIGLALMADGAVISVASPATPKTRSGARNTGFPTSTCPACAN